MSAKEKRPRKFRGRAPWRWHWGRILLVPVLWAGWLMLLRWSAWFGIPLAFYLYAQLRAACNEPLPSPTAEKESEGKEAGQGFAYEQDPDQPNRWKVTKSE